MPSSKRTVSVTKPRKLNITQRKKVRPSEYETESQKKRTDEIRKKLIENDRLRNLHKKNKMKKIRDKLEKNEKERIRIIMQFRQNHARDVKLYSNARHKYLTQKIGPRTTNEFMFDPSPVSVPPLQSVKNIQ